MSEGGRAGAGGDEASGDAASGDSFCTTIDSDGGGSGTDCAWDDDEDETNADPG